jgi:DNA-binding NarL/FixJ family response regulator
MKPDNSTYTVTAPDLMLTENGMSVLISCNDEKKIEEIKDIFEKIVHTSLIFNVQRAPTNENTVAWMWYVSQPADIMIVDLDTASTTDVCAALLRKKDPERLTVFLSEKNKKKDLVRLINATGHYPILNSIDELDFYIKFEMKVEDAQ